MTTAVRATTAAKQTLEELARELGEPQTSVLERALKLLKTHLKFERGRAAYAELRRDEKAWAEFTRAQVLIMAQAFSFAANYQCI